MRGGRMAVLCVALTLALTGCATPSGTVAPAGTAAPDGCGADVPGLQRRVADVGGARIHYAIGGRGPTLVLVHGFPETWRVWRGVATRLLDRFTVVVPDLRGIGCSSPEAGGYDAVTRAGDLHRLVAVAGVARPVVVVGHDLGGMVAYTWARLHRDEVAALVVSGAGIPGFGLAELAPPHVARFAADPDRVVADVTGRERAWLAAFTGSEAFERSGALDDAVVAYGRPGRLRLALRQYRELAADAAANRADPGGPLRMPVTALEGGAPGIASATLPRVATSVRTVVVPGTGHYLLVERPDAVAAAIADAVPRR